MQLFYCDGCGKRITVEPIRVGSAENEKLYCPACVPKGAPAPAPAPEPVSAPAATPNSTAHMAAAMGQSEKKITAMVPSARGANEKTATLRASRSTAVPRQATSRSSAPSPAHGNAQQQNPTALYAAIGGGLLLLGIVAFFMLHGGDNPSTANEGGDKSEAHPSAKPPSPAPKLPSPPAPPSSVTRTAPPPPPPSIPAPPPPAPPPPVPIPANGPKASELLAISTPPPNDTAWKLLLNGKDLTGWTPAKGKWTVEAGEVVGDGTGPGTGTFARLDTNEEFGDIEVIVQFKSDSVYAGIKVRDVEMSQGFHGSGAATVHEFRVVALGNAVAASLDGAPMSLEGKFDPKTLPTKGLIRLFTTNGSKSTFRSVKVRELKAADLGKPVAVQPAPKAGEWTEWRDISPVKDQLGNWQRSKGTWKAEDSQLVGDGGTTSARVETTFPLKDFELTAKFMLTGGRRAEVHIRNYSSYFSIDPDKADTWVEVHVTAVGDDQKCTVNGEARPMQRDGDMSVSGEGNFGFYCSKSIQMFVKEIKVREFKTK